MRWFCMEIKDKIFNMIKEEFGVYDENLIIKILELLIWYENNNKRKTDRRQTKGDK